VNSPVLQLASPFVRNAIIASHCASLGKDMIDDVNGSLSKMPNPVVISSSLKADIGVPDD
jgi:hypothetical protein